MKIDGGLMTTDLRDAARLAAHAERLGYDGRGTAEAGHAPYLPAALAATATERITIGTNIAVAFPRSPLVHAQVAWDLQAASRGRFVLGLGTQVKGHNERRYSTPWLAPGPRLREMILLIRHIWEVWQHGARPGFAGKYRDEIERAKAPVRQQLSFYASTRTYIGVLEAHGWGETCLRLNEKAAKGDWAGMASLITDEMLEVYAVEGTYDDIPELLKKKYGGGSERRALCAPGRPRAG